MEGPEEKEKGGKRRGSTKELKMESDGEGGSFEKVETWVYL